MVVSNTDAARTANVVVVGYDSYAYLGLNQKIITPING